MKKFFLFSSILFSSLLFVQCKNQSEKNDFTVPKLTKITGHVHNRNVQPNTREIRLKIPYLYVKNYHFEHDAFHIISPLCDDGKFNFEFMLAQSQNITLENYLEMLYLRPGDSLHVELDFSRPRTVQFSGTQSAVELNTDLFKFFYATGFRGKDYRGCDIPGCGADCSWDEVKELLNEQRKNFHKRRQDFLQQNRVHKDVEFLTKAMIELDYYSKLVEHLIYRKYTDWDCVDPQPLMDEMNLAVAKYFDTDLFSKSHYQFVAMYKALAEFIKPIRDTDFVEWTKAVGKTNEIRKAMLAREASRALREKDLERFEELSAHIGRGSFSNRLNHEHQVILEYLNDPEPMSAIILGSRSDFLSHSENVLQRIIEPNLGSVQMVLLGGYCCAIDYFQTLEFENANKDVNLTLFLHYQSPEDEKRFRQQIRERGMNEASFYFPTLEESQFVARKFRGLSNMGHGLLINRQGVVVDYGAHIGVEKNRQRKIDLLLEQDRLIKP